MKYESIKKPDFLIPGFPKCGTTWIYERLSELSEFKMPPQKELHFFDREKSYSNGEAGSTPNKFINRKRLIRNFDVSGLDFFQIFLSLYEKNDDTYLKLFNNLKGLSGDITPTYAMLAEEGVKKVSTLLPGIKIIFIMRDPIERAWSQFRMHLTKQNLLLTDYDIDEVITYLEDDLQKRRGQYISSIDRYAKFFENSEIMLTYYDSLKENPHYFLKNLVKFIGGNPKPVDKLENLRKHSNVSIKQEIPDRVFNHLKTRYHDEMKTLAQRYGGYSQHWYDKYYDKSTELRSVDISKDSFVILN